VIAGSHQSPEDDGQLKKTHWSFYRYEKVDMVFTTGEGDQDGGRQWEVLKWFNQVTHHTLRQFERNTVNSVLTHTLRWSPLGMSYCSLWVLAEDGQGLKKNPRDWLQ
jgi:hypothetical protein